MRGEPAGGMHGLVHELLAEEIATLLADGPARDDPAGLEQLALTLLVPLGLPELPPDLPAAFLETIERRGNEDAAGVLAALAVLAGEPLAGEARAAADRLADEGVVSPVAARLGTLAVREAVRVEGPGGELLLVLLRRPGTRKLQLAVLGIDHEDAGEVLTACMLTPPLSAADARALVDGRVADEDATGAGPIGVDELTARVVAAARRAIDTGVALGHEAGLALPLLARALTGDPHGLPCPELLPPWEDDDPELIVDAAEDEDAFHELEQLLLDELEEFAKKTYPAGGAVWCHGDFVASTMLAWKGGYGDGRLGRWTGDDLAEYLLDHFPRKVYADEETLAALPECMVAFLRLLDARGSLSGEPLEELEEACAALYGEFLDRESDPAARGLAKTIVMQMEAEGIVPGDPEALERWVDDFNSRPRSERDAVIGPAADRMLEAASTPQPAGPGARDRRARRKAQRTARKRGRRRG